MIHTQVYGFFQTCLPDQAKEVKEYFPNDEIRSQSASLLRRAVHTMDDVQ